MSELFYILQLYFALLHDDLLHLVLHSDYIDYIVFCATG